MQATGPVPHPRVYSAERGLHHPDCIHGADTRGGVLHGGRVLRDVLVGRLRLLQRVPRGGGAGLQ
eukprot:8315744-Pyramimonas_sp.AAC.1